VPPIQYGKLGDLFEFDPEIQAEWQGLVGDGDLVAASDQLVQVLLQVMLGLFIQLRWCLPE
jgi:hypothetical protein